MEPIVNLVVSEQFTTSVGVFNFNEITNTVLRHQEIAGLVELSIVIEDDDYIRQLNKDYRGFDSATDVLSFPSDEFDPDSNSQYIGDIIISFPMAQKQAQASGHPVQNEITLLAVHGILHLLGHDHETLQEKVIMWQAQSEILNTLNCELGRIPGDEDDHL